MPWSLSSCNRLNHLPSSPGKALGHALTHCSYWAPAQPPSLLLSIYCCHLPLLAGASWLDYSQAAGWDSVRHIFFLPVSLGRIWQQPFLFQAASSMTHSMGKYWNFLIPDALFGAHFVIPGYSTLSWIRKPWERSFLEKWIPMQKDTNHKK